MYDVGGISCHRSLQSSLLEGFTELIPLPRAESIDSIASFEDLLREVQSRSLCHQMDFDFDRVEYTAFLSLAGLHKWYELDLTKYGDPATYHYHFMKERIDAVCRLLPLPEIQSTATFEHLAEIAKNARSLVCDQATRSQKYLCVD
jgi:hypothetical protein